MSGHVHLLSPGPPQREDEASGNACVQQTIRMIPRRVAYVLKIFPKLSETFIAGELAELKRRGIELRILSLLPPREELQHDIIADAGLDKLTIYGEENFSSALKEFKPQLLHAHFATESTA